jgi:hypothetical protein
MMRFPTWPLIAMLLMAGCETVPSDFVAVCPPVSVYSERFQARLSDELRTLPESSNIAIIVRDYLKLRDDLRECRLERASDVTRL